MLRDVHDVAASSHETDLADGLAGLSVPAAVTVVVVVTHLPEGLLAVPDRVVDGPGREGDVTGLDEGVLADELHVGGEAGDVGLVTLGDVAVLATEDLTENKISAFFWQISCLNLPDFSQSYPHI